MKIYEAMVEMRKEDCPMCAPGTTYAGTHTNIIHMVTPAFDEGAAKIWFENFGTLTSKVKEVGHSRILAEEEPYSWI